MECYNKRYGDSIPMDRLNRISKETWKVKTKLKNNTDININGCIDRLKCLNMLTKLESYSIDLDNHLNLFSKLE